MPRAFKMALALGGGGARGIAHAGVLGVLETHGLVPDFIVGTSAGALVGGAYALAGTGEAMWERLHRGLAEGSLAKLERRFNRKTHSEPGGWRDRLEHAITQMQRIALAHRQAVRPALVPETALRELIRGIVGRHRFEDLKLPFYAMAFDLAAGRDVIINTGLLETALWASSAIPGVFQPVAMAGRVLVDGCVFQAVPAQAARWLGADFVIAVDISTSAPKTIPHSAAAVAARVSELRAERLRDLNLASADVIIRPEVGDIHWTEISRAEGCREAGRTAAERMIDQIRKALRRQRWRTLPRRIAGVRPRTVPGKPNIVEDVSPAVPGDGPGAMSRSRQEK